MNINTRNMAFVNFNGQEMQWVKYNGVTIYEAFKNLLANGVPPLTLTKCKGVDLIDYKLYGNSVQEIENIFDINTMSTRIDAYITTGGNWTYSKDSYSIRVPVKSNTTYTVSTENSIEIFRVGCVEVEDVPLVAGNSFPLVNAVRQTDNTPITIKTTKNTLYLVIQATATTMSETLKTLKVEQAQISPETPIEIESVGERTKNLCNIGTITFTQYKEIKLVEPIPAGTYTLSCNITTTDTDANDNLVTFLNANGDTIVYLYGLYRDGRTSKVFTLTETAYSILLYASNNWNYGSGDTATYKDIQIEKGSKATSFEGYYKIPVKISGKNLLNNDEIKSLNYWTKIITSDNKERYIYSLDLKPGEYFISGDYEKKDGYLYIQYSTDNGESWLTAKKLLLEDEISTLNFVVNSNEKWRLWANTANVISYIKQIQIERGNVQTEYEPYIEPITTNINLNEPLRKVGDYEDYIDFEKGEIVREIAVVDMSKLSWFRRGGSIDYYFDYTLNFKEIYGNNEFAKVKPPLMCTHYDIATRYNMYNKKCTVPSVSHFILNSRKTLALYSKGHEDATALINSLQGAMLYYVLEENSVKSIELPNIPTFKGTTILEVDTTIQPSNLEVVYKGKK